MVVGEDVAVLGDDKAGAGGRAGDGLAKDVGADDVHGDAHAGADILGVNLRGGQFLLRVHRGGVHLGGGSVAGVNGGPISAGDGIVHRMGQTAHQGAHQTQGHDL